VTGETASYEDLIGTIKNLRVVPGGFVLSKTLSVYYYRNIQFRLKAVECAPSDSDRIPGQRHVLR